MLFKFKKREGPAKENVQSEKDSKNEIGMFS